MAATHNGLRIAILDMYDGKENQGMRCIREIINLFSDTQQVDIDFDEYNVRQRNELPNLDYDVYITTGGPGSPIESTAEEWDINWCTWLNSVIAYNQNKNNYNKKHVFFICHSFQLAARHLNIGTVSARKSNSFGVFPIHLLPAGEKEPVFEGLQDPFYVVDSRDWQVTAPNYDVIDALDASLLCIEKDRPHINLERAIMGFRLNEFMIGTQFHPEADAKGMSMYLQTADKKAAVIKQHGLAKWESMIEQLQDPDKILFTYSHILPNFLQIALVGLLQEA